MLVNSILRYIFNRVAGLYGILQSQTYNKIANYIAILTTKNECQKHHLRPSSEKEFRKSSERYCKLLETGKENTPIQKGPEKQSCKTHEDCQ